MAFKRSAVRSRLSPPKDNSRLIRRLLFSFLSPLTSRSGLQRPAFRRTGQLDPVCLCQSAILGPVLPAEPGPGSVSCAVQPCGKENGIRLCMLRAFPTLCGRSFSFRITARSGRGYGGRRGGAWPASERSSDHSCSTPCAWFAAMGPSAYTR